MKYPCCKCCCDTQPLPYLIGRCRYSRGVATGHTEPCPNQKKDTK